MATIRNMTRTDSFSSSGSSSNRGSGSGVSATHAITSNMDALDWLPDTILDEITDAVDAFEPLTPLELVLGDWDAVDIEPVIMPMATVTRETVKQETTEESSSSDSGDTQPRVPMKNPSRERLRAELKFLRQRVVEMETELEATRQQQQRLQTRKRPAVPWDQVALNELKKRQRAEEENRNLCSALAKQTTVAKGLEQLLHDHHGAEAFARFCDMDNAPSRPSEACDDEAVFVRLGVEVSSAYAAVDRVLDECHMGDAEVLFSSSQSNVTTTAATDGSGVPQILLELVDSKFVPFDFARTCDAFWRALSTATVYEHHAVDLLTKSTDSIRFKSRLTWHLNGEQRKLRCLLVLKRYMTANRMVVAWRGVMASEETPDRTHGVAFGWEETGWIVVREMETGVASIVTDDGCRDQHEKPCVLQTITRHVPHWRRAAPSLASSSSSVDPVATEREIGAFTSMVLSATEDDMAHVIGAMQSLLLAEVLDGVSAAVAVES